MSFLFTTPVAAQRGLPTFSQVVQVMRFPLNFAVLYAHMVPSVNPQVYLSLDMYHIRLFIVEMLSHNLAKIAVPCFFAFAGYFFFFGVTALTPSIYINKLRNRIKTLLVPYLIFNALFVIAILLKNYVFMRFGHPADDGLTSLKQITIADIFWNYPLNFSLWFMRDLMCVTVLAPLFCYYFKYTRGYGLTLLLILYMLNISSGIPGFSTAAFAFFGMGAWFAIYNKGILHMPRSIKYSCIFLAAALLIISTAHNHSPLHPQLVQSFVVFGVFSSIFIFSYLAKYPKLSHILSSLAKVTFFTYAIHLIYIIGWIKGGILKLTPYTTQFGQLLLYLTGPVICMAVCTGLYYLLRRICPTLLAVSVGGRIHNFHPFKANKL